MDFTKPVICADCGETVPRQGGKQLRCVPCSDSRRLTKQRVANEEKRRSHGTPKRGAEYPCPSCGTPVVYRSGPANMCSPCRKAMDYTHVKRWLASRTPAQLKAFRARLKDVTFFGGNRSKALERDGHRCVRCGSGDNLHVHHKDGNGTTVPRAQRNNRLANLETLCKGCHTAEHNRRRAKEKQGDVRRDGETHSSCAP